MEGTVVYLAKNWWMFLLRGILALIFGLLALFQPASTMLVVVWVFGIFMLVDGIIAVISAFTSNAKSEHWWFIIIGGILGIILGILTLYNPLAMGIAWVYLIAIWAIGTGIFMLITGIRLRKEIEGEVWMIIGGILSVIFGLLVLFNPASGAIAIGIIVGIYAVVFGIMFIALSIRMKKYGDEPIDGRSAAAPAVTESTPAPTEAASEPVASADETPADNVDAPPADKEG